MEHCLQRAINKKSTTSRNWKSHPEANKLILRDFYIDDLVTGTKSVATTKQLMNDPSLYGFPLSKDIMKNLKKSSTPHFIWDNKFTKTLKLLWDTQKDTFQLTINCNMKEDRVTKRAILSIISQTSVPLGLLGSVVIKVKIILQKLWQLKLNWEEYIPGNFYIIWIKFFNKIHTVNNYKFPDMSYDYNWTSLL